jgi:hypothetical protein
VLSADEQTAFDELQRPHTEQVGATRSPRSRRRTPLAFVVLWWLSVLTVIVGGILPGMGMAAAVALGWLLGRHTPELGDMVEAASNVADDGDDRAPRPSRGGSRRVIRTRRGRHDPEGCGDGRRRDKSPT